MSFTGEVKAEISKNELLDCCAKAQLAGLIQSSGSINISNKTLALTTISQNPTVTKRVFSLTKKLYGSSIDLSMLKQMRFKKNNQYQLTIKENVKEILNDLGILKDFSIESFPKNILRKDCCKRAYLAGCFLAKGSINSPITTNYHLEIVANDSFQAQGILKLINKYDLKAKIIKRRNQEVIYLKTSEKIGDFLRLVGAYESLMKFEDIRIQRDLMNSMIRSNNCEIANEVKVLKMADKQIQDIEIINQSVGLDYLEDKLKLVAQLRLANSEASLNDLVLLYYQSYKEEISKSGIRHRFNKINKIAEQFKYKL
ncbi:MAG: DNA-binding protein WhiA [Erysipelotrichaceae bacterium]